MKAFIQGINCPAKTIKELDATAVTEITDGIFRVRSQYEPEKSYIVNLNHGDPYCNCPDGERTLFCKHRIASLLYLAAPRIGTLERSEP
ncbi:MAG: SWIM zinc finger family protein [Candidatus Poribacteria bacterium]